MTNSIKNHLLEHRCSKSKKTHIFIFDYIIPYVISIKKPFKIIVNKGKYKYSDEETFRGNTLVKKCNSVYELMLELDKYILPEHIRFFITGKENTGFIKLDDNYFLIFFSKDKEWLIVPISYSGVQSFEERFNTSLSEIECNCLKDFIEVLKGGEYFLMNL